MITLKINFPVESQVEMGVFESVNRLPLTITFDMNEIGHKQLQQDVICREIQLNR